MEEPHIHLVDHTDNERDETQQHPQNDTEKHKPEHHIDILYENQRGWFVFGIPLFSSKALWNLRVDPSPWVGPDYKPSAVNITNAQVSDPSWKWEWPSWYVDMSGDVDEEGWQYSFYFRGFAWHGNHPWFHSFVRRRRWLRKRVKQRIPAKARNSIAFGETLSIGTSIARTSTIGPVRTRSDPQQDAATTDEIHDTATLMARLKRAAVDREKIVAIDTFLRDGGEELHYLAEKIPAIMSMLIFQNSRRQLLSKLMQAIDAAREHREEHKRKGEPEDAAEERRINSLLKAVEAANTECKQLEYWSDIRKLATDGTAGYATDATRDWDHKWEGRDESGPALHP